jgi:hypothetical protein
VIAFLHQGGEGKSLSGTPVDCLSGLDTGGSRFENLSDETMESFVLRENCDFISDIFESVYFDSRFDGFGNFMCLDSLPLISDPILSLELMCLTLNISFFK